MVQRRLTPEPVPGKELDTQYFDTVLGAMVTIIKVVRPAFYKENVLKSGGVYIIEEVGTKDQFHYNSQLETYSSVKSPLQTKPLGRVQVDLVLQVYRKRIEEQKEDVDNAIGVGLSKISTLEIDRAIDAGKTAQNKIFREVIKFSRREASGIASQKYGQPLDEEQAGHIEEAVLEEVGDYIETFVRSYVENRRAQYLSSEGLMLGGERAIVPPEKLTGYALKADHPVGKFKATQFKNQLGITADNYIVLQEALQKAARDSAAEIGTFDKFGQRLTIFFKMNGVGEMSKNEATVESGWIIPTIGEAPKLTSCYIVAGKGEIYRAYFEDMFLVTGSDWPDHLVDPNQAYKTQPKVARKETRRTKQSNRLYQERIYDEQGYPVKDIDYTSPTNDAGDPHLGAEGGEHLGPPHQHRWSGSPEKGFTRGPAEPQSDL